MTEQPEHPIESEPIESGTDPVQSEGSPTDSSALVKAKARGPLVGHPLPDALRDIAPAFRSHPVWLLVCQWTNQVIEDHQNTKKELAETKDKFEAVRSELHEKKIENAGLSGKLREQAKICSYKTRWQAMGTLFLGLSPAAYLNTFPIYGFIMAGVGILFLYFAWRENVGN